MIILYINMCKIIICITRDPNPTKKKKKWRCKLQHSLIYKYMINRRWWTTTIKPAGNQKLVSHCSIEWIASLWPMIWLLIIIFLYEHIYTASYTVILYMINNNLCKEEKAPYMRNPTRPKFFIYCISILLFEASDAMMIILLFFFLKRKEEDLYRNDHNLTSKNI